jgi:hypothetical protein
MNKYNLNVLSAETLSYNWTPIELLNNSTIQNPTAYITTPTWFVVSAENETTLCTIQDSVFVGLDFLPCCKRKYISFQMHLLQMEMTRMISYLYVQLS